MYIKLIFLLTNCRKKNTKNKNQKRREEDLQKRKKLRGDRFQKKIPPKVILGPPEIYFGHFGRIRGGFRAILCARIRPKTPEMQISGEFGRFFLSENRLGRVLLIFAKNFLYLEIFDVKSVKISNNRKLLYT